MPSSTPDKLWKYLIPTYGNWGGPGWSSGQWCPTGEVDWSVEAVDDLDQCFKNHDLVYQILDDARLADVHLVRLLDLLPRLSVWTRPTTTPIRTLLYLAFARLVFSLRLKLNLYFIDSWLK